MKRIIFFVKNWFFRPKAMAFYAELKTNDTVSTNEIARIQLEKISKLFQYAKHEIPFYKSKYENIGIDEITSWDDFEKLPVLTKDEIRDHGNSFYKQEAMKKYGRQVVTGGSTGVPLQVYHDRRFPFDVLSWRVLDWWGTNISDNIAFIYRLLRKGLNARLHEALWYPTRRIFLDASSMNDSTMNEFAMRILHLRPKVVQGYVGGVYEFAKFCERKGYSFPFIKAVWVTSAPLAESHRIYIENILDCPVYDQYGCSEIFWIAAECKEKKGLHVMADSRIVEIIDGDGKAIKTKSYGDIVVTDLENYVFPLIRYANGDRGRMLHQTCACGVNLPLLDKVKGRVSDVLRLPDGGVISGEYLTTIFDDKPYHVSLFQVRQHKDYSVDLICVPTEEVDSIDVCELKCQELRLKTEDKIIVRLKIVEDIQHAQGKTRFIISELS